MAIGHVKCPSCEGWVEYDTDIMGGVATDFIQHKYEPSKFTCPNCGVIHLKRKFEPKYHLFCSCGSDVTYECLKKF
ncbi:MAG: hypothetical protein WCX48_10950 [Bacteroidales bacterium]